MFLNLDPPLQIDPFLSKEPSSFTRSFCITQIMFSSSRDTFSRKVFPPPHPLFLNARERRIVGGIENQTAVSFQGSSFCMKAPGEEFLRFETPPPRTTSLFPLFKRRPWTEEESVPLGQFRPLSHPGLLSLRLCPLPSAPSSSQKTSPASTL